MPRGFWGWQLFCRLVGVGMCIYIVKTKGQRYGSDLSGSQENGWLLEEVVVRHRKERG